MKKLKEILAAIVLIALGVTFSRLFPTITAIILIIYIAIYLIKTIYNNIKGK